MSEETVAARAADAPISARDAGALIGAIRKEPEPESAAPSPEETGATPDVSAPEADAGPDEVPGETEVADPAPDEPSIERPRSWAKEHDEAFKALPRHLQEVVAESERAREADFLRRQNEAAELIKATEAREQAAEQTRQQYEQALPNLLQAIEAEYNRDFGDIKSWDDVNRIAQEDPIRYNKWQASFQRAQAVRTETEQAQTRQQHDNLQKFNSFCEEQTKLFLEKAPEFADPKQATQKQSEARAYMQEIGFQPEEMMSYWNGAPISIRDARLQLIVRDAMLYRAAQAKAKAPAKTPVPPVQRPGTAPAKGEAKVAQLKDLETKLDRTGSLRDAARLLSAQRRRVGA